MEASSDNLHQIDCALPNDLVIKYLDEAVNELDLGISWVIFCEEYSYWEVPKTLKEFHKIFDLVSTGLAGKKLWMVAPIIAAYFGCTVLNFDDNFWDNHNSSFDEIYDVATSRWSAVCDSETGKLFGYRYNAARLWQSIKMDFLRYMKLQVKYNEPNANSICCYRKIYTKYKPEEIEIQEVEEMLRSSFGDI